MRLIQEDTERVIKEHESMMLQDDVFDRFINACEAAESPNQKLLEAMEFTKKQGIQ